MEIPNFISWYKKANNEFRTYNYETKELHTLTKLKDDINQFEMNDKTYEHIDDSVLIQYSEDIIVWRNEILSHKTFKFPFDYFDNDFICDGKPFYRTHHNNILTFIKRFINKNYKDFETISILEESYYLKCNRGGLTYCKKGIYDCHSYDFKFFYPSIMASDNFKIATTQGVETTITLDIPKRFKYGIYNVKISSDDENFNKIFKFSSEDYYTHYSLNFCLWYNKHYGEKVTLSIISTTALIYDTDELVEGSKIFSCWYHRLLDLKASFPKNKLVKTLASTSWGALTSTNVIIKTEEQVINENLNISTDFDSDYYIKDVILKNDDTEIYKLIDTRKPIYKLQFRLKAFLTDYARIYMAKVALEDIDDVVRIQTDGITYDKSIEKNITNLVKDDKKTGRIEWLNVNAWRYLS